MKAIAVHPGTPNSMHLREVPEPKLSDIPDGRGVLDVLLPLAGIGVAGYTLYRNVYPVPDFPFNVFPYIVAGWLALGTAVATLVPGFAKRLGTELALRL